METTMEPQVSQTWTQPHTQHASTTDLKPRPLPSLLLSLAPFSSLPSCSPPRDHSSLRWRFAALAFLRLGARRPDGATGVVTRTACAGDASTQHEQTECNEV